MATVDGMTPQRIETVMTQAVQAKTEQLRDDVVLQDRFAAEVAADVALEASAVAVTAASMVTVYTGKGFPEGVVEAPVGSTYIDTDATAGAIRWIKTSGTGNAGWEVEYGNTGWRNITDLFDPPVTSGSVRVRKTPVSVDFLFYYVVAPDGAMVSLSRSFGSGTSQNAPLFSSGGVQIGVVLSHYSGRLTIQRSSTTTNCTVSIPSETSWPSTLPGTPA